MVSQIVYMVEPGAKLDVSDLFCRVTPRVPMGQEVTEKRPKLQAAEEKHRVWYEVSPAFCLGKHTGGYSVRGAVLGAGSQLGDETSGNC